MGGKSYLLHGIHGLTFGGSVQIIQSKSVLSYLEVNNAHHNHHPPTLIMLTDFYHNTEYAFSASSRLSLDVKSVNLHCFFVLKSYH